MPYELETHIESRDDELYVCTACSVEGVSRMRCLTHIITKKLREQCPHSMNTIPVWNKLD